METSSDIRSEISDSISKRLSYRTQMLTVEEANELRAAQSYCLVDVEVLTGNVSCKVDALYGLCLAVQGSVIKFSFTSAYS